jgi:hypothetical protein
MSGWIISAIEQAQKKIFFENAKSVYMKAVYGAYIGCITSNQATDLYYIMQKQGVDPTRELGKLFQTMEVLDVDGSDCINALVNGMTDFEDSLIVESMKRHGLDIIITRNEKDFVDGNVRVYSPAKFLQLVKENGIF